jgi:hypothetical protein
MDESLLHVERLIQDFVPAARRSFCRTPPLPPTSSPSADRECDGGGESQSTRGGGPFSCLNARSMRQGMTGDCTPLSSLDRDNGASSTLLLPLPDSMEDNYIRQPTSLAPSPAPSPSPFLSTPRYMLLSADKRNRDEKLKEVAKSCDNLLNSITKLTFQ